MGSQALLGMVFGSSTAPRAPSPLKRSNVSEVHGDLSTVLSVCLLSRTIFVTSFFVAVYICYVPRGASFLEVSSLYFERQANNNMVFKANLRRRRTSPDSDPILLALLAGQKLTTVTPNCAALRQTHTAVP